MVTQQDGVAGIVRRADKKRGEMRQWFNLLEELAHFFHHLRKGFITEQPEGQEMDPDIWDSSPEGHRQRLANETAQAICPDNRYWVGLQPARIELLQDDEIRLWCQTVAYMMYVVITDPAANFKERWAELVDDLSSFGSGVIYIDHNRAKGHLVFQVMHLKNFAFEIDASGNVIRCYCWWTMSLDDLVNEFGVENLPEELQNEWKKPSADCSRTYEVLHAVVPNDDFARYGMGPGRLPLASLWILVQGAHVLDKGGYHEFPYVLTRWYRKSGEALGRCEAMRALSDARLMQSVASALLEITEKQGNPPMQGPIDILRGEVELWPGGFTAFDASGFQYQGDPIRPIEIGSNPAMTAEYLQYLDKKIGRIFYAEYLNMPMPGDGNAMDSDQKLAQDAMRAMVLAPILSRVENESAPPILDRVFNIMMRANVFPPVPELLVGERLVYMLDNKVSDMRDLAKAQQSFQSLAMPLQLEIPEIVATAVESVDWDTAFRDLWRMTKVPARWVKPMEMVMAERQQREQMQQAAAMAELAKAGGPGVKSMIEGAVTARDQGLLPPPQ